MAGPGLGMMTTKAKEKMPYVGVLSHCMCKYLGCLSIPHTCALSPFLRTDGCYTHYGFRLIYGYGLDFKKILEITAPFPQLADKDIEIYRRASMKNTLPPIACSFVPDILEHLKQKEIGGSYNSATCKDD